MTAEAKVKLTGEDKELEKSLDRSVNNLEDFGKKATKILKLVAGAFVIKKVFDLGAAIVSISSDTERAQKRLESVLNATGHAAGFTNEQMNQLAKQMSDSTGITEELLTNTQAVIATFKNVRGDQFKEATMLAADMAEVLQSDVKSAAIQVAKALNDPVIGMSALAESGVSFTEQQKEMVKALMESGDIIGAQKVILEELRGEFGGAAEAAGETFSGQVAKLKNEFTAMAVELGQALLPAIKAMMPLLSGVASAIKAVAPLVKNMIEGIVEWGGAIFKFLQPAFDFLVTTGVAAFTVIQVAVQNFSDVARAVLLKFSLTVIQVFEGVKHFITVVIPGYLAWFGRNWANIFTDIAVLTGTIFSNMWKNIKQFFKGVWTWLKGGGGRDFKWTSLTDGFESTLEELPKIQKRITTESEKALGAELGVIQRRLANRFKAQFDANMKGIKGAFKGADDEITKEIKANQARIDELRAGPSTGESIAEEQRLAKKNKELKDKKKKKDEKKEEEQFTSGIEDLVALSSRITAAAASSNPLVEGQKKANRLSEQQLRRLDKIVDIRERQLRAAEATKKALHIRRIAFGLDYGLK